MKVLGGVLKGTGMAVAFRKPNIDAVNDAPTSAVGDEVGRLDIAMDDMVAMHNLDAFQHLIGDSKDYLEAELGARTC